MFNLDKTEKSDTILHNPQLTARNVDVNNIVMPVNIDKLEQLLRESNYCEKETAFLVNGFRNGFDIGYEDPQQRADTAKNLPFREVGSDHELWDKLMKEVALG